MFPWRKKQQQRPAGTKAVDHAITFDQLSEHLDPSLLPHLDQPTVDESTLTPEQLSWRRDGVVVLPRLLPDHLIDAYIEARKDIAPAGWLMATPYLHVPALRDLALYPPLMAVMQSLIGEPMMLHLALTGWISTERDWHQDDYLNPPFVACWYAAVWMALDDIHPDSGPFEYVPGSHRWPLMRGEKVRSFLSEEELTRANPLTGLVNWEKFSERFTTPAIENKIRDSGAPVTRFLARRGDVLIWHGSLMHRGSLARVPGMPRRSLITHYSGINHRPDMLDRRQTEAGHDYAWFDLEHK
jgi:hypothetical protein